MLGRNDTLIPITPESDLISSIIMAAN